MKSLFSLYCRGHRLGSAISIIVLVTVLLILREGYIIAIPWLRGSRDINLGTLCAFLYSSTSIIIFRNEISRLESLSPRSWIRMDIGIMSIMWILPWSLTLTRVSTQFAYITTMLLGICVIGGRYLNVDTLILLLVSQIIIDTALWNTFENTPAQHILFILDSPPDTIKILVSFLTFLISTLCITHFKRREY